MTDFVCPRCRGALDRESPDGFFCPADRLTFERRRGIWRFLTPEAVARTAGFIREYETVRRAEGRGWPTSNDYRKLPHTDPADPLAGMWRIRAASFRCFEQHVLGRMTGRQRVADLGGGSGWLAYRIANQGHSVDAVDLLDNDWDGLGAYRHYEDAFRPVQASFDELPYRPEVFDLVVFNAAFHYSVDYEATLRYTLAVLKPGGAIAVIDTPVYRQEESGRRMVSEREREFTGRFGFPSNALPLENFLTYKRLETLAASHGLAVRMHSPRTSLRRRLEPLAARLRRRREPARFPVIVLATKQP